MLGKVGKVVEVVEPPPEIPQSYRTSQNALEASTTELWLKAPQRDPHLQRQVQGCRRGVGDDAETLLDVEIDLVSSFVFENASVE